MMKQRPMYGWERRLRQMGHGLVDGIRNIFGSGEAVVYRPPEPPRHPERGPAQDEPSHTPAPHAGRGDRLPPRERRGRD